MMLPIKRLDMIYLPLLIAAAFASTLAGGAHAQAWPAKPIRIVCTLAAGGGVDSTARIVGQGWTESWG